MAKGVEDTAFYRVSRLASLTEVGADPAEFSMTIAEFHERQQTRLAAHPLSMTTLSTHDTKRGEDTRARISVIAEVPEQWAAFLSRRRAQHPLADGAFENMLWESVVGSWPREREALHSYAEKAAREAAKRLDHQFLNEIAPFDEINPTAEHIAVWFFVELSGVLNQPNARVNAITVWENDYSAVTYRA
ncbi:MAG: hypothetical protein B7Z82_00855 [Halothiobacillus sp. 20-54-6]|nr:MAG: hypothetical protein B7Z82_00855 [Halothiobacillus sp. 20-54-6]